MGANDIEPVQSRGQWWNGSYPINIREILDIKIALANSYEKFDLALTTLNHDSKTPAPDELGKPYACDYFTMRAWLLNRVGKFDLAVADLKELTAKSNLEDLRCYNGFEVRGESNLGLGNFEAAIADFTIALGGQLMPRSEEAYRKRGIAYLKTGQYEKAVEDFTQYMKYRTASAEVLRLRAEAYRLAGKESNALEDERLAFGRENGAAYGRALVARKHALYGKLVMPNGTPIDPDNAQVLLRYSDGTREGSLPIVDSEGRFEFSYMKPLGFFIFAYCDVAEGGVMKRYFVRTPVIPPKEGLMGPLVLTLDKSVIKGSPKK